MGRKGEIGNNLSPYYVQVNQDVVEKNARVSVPPVEDVRFPSGKNKTVISFSSFGPE